MQPENNVKHNPWFKTQSINKKELMTDWAEHMALKKRVQDAKAKSREVSQTNSKKKLLRAIETKFKTSFIGALNQFEKKFGFLWGHGKPDSELTSSELEFKELWNEARAEVLNNGNNQLRASQEEIAEYTMEKNKHEINLPVKPRSEGNE